MTMARMRHMSCLLSVVLLLVASAAGASPIKGLHESWRWVRFGTESGLLSERIFGVYESGDGTMWAHTGRGMAWFDGTQWHPQEVPGLAEAAVLGVRIAPDTVGLLVAYAGLLHSVRQDGVERIVARTAAGDTIGSAGAWRDHDGSIISLGSHRLNILRDGQVLPQPASPSVRYAVFPVADVNHLLPSGRKLWMKSDASLYCYEGNGAWTRVYESPYGFLRVHQIATTDSGEGIAILEPVAGDVRVFRLEGQSGITPLAGEVGDLIQSVAAGPSGAALFLYSSGRLRVFEEGRWRWLPPLPAPVLQARSLWFRSNGDLWVAGDDGLFVCRLTVRRWDVWEEPEESLSNWVNAIIRARDGAFWVGTRDGVQRRDASGRVRWFRSIGGVPLGRVTAVAEAADGAIWIGSGASFSGAFRWDGGTWRHFGEEDGLVAPRVHRIMMDRKGRLWFLCLNQTGVLKQDLSDEPGAFVLDDGRFVRWAKADGLLDGRVYSVVEDRHGGYWFGSFTGISRYRDGMWKYWTHTDGLYSPRVFTLTVTPDDRVYFGHQYSHIGYIDERDSVHYVTREAGLLGVEIWEIVADHRGWLWIGSKSGLVCRSNDDWFRFDTRTGLRNDRLWPVLPLENDVYLGTEGNGVAILHLDGLETSPPRVVFDPPLIEGDDATLEWRTYARGGDVPPDLIETRHRLSDGSWSPWSLDHGAKYRSLDPGAYVLEVQAKGALLQSAMTVTRLPFEIPPPLYLRPVFAIPVGMLTVLVLGLTMLVYIRNQAHNKVTRENEARFRAQYKGNPIPTFTFRKTPEGFALSDYNDAALTITLGNARNWIGLLYDEILPQSPQGKVFLEQCYRSRTTVRTDFRYQYTSIPRAADLTVTFAFVPPDLVLVHTEDVTERKRYERQLQESGEQLRALAARVQTVREEERTMLSREIHDELGQLMTGLKMDLAWIRRRVLDLGRGLPDAVAERMAQMNGLLEDAIRTVRKIAGQLRPTILDDLGLVPAMEWQAREFGTRTGIQLDLAVQADDIRLTGDTATEFFRIYQELLTNVARHARATLVEVHLGYDGDSLVLEVRDNGCGIDQQDVERPSSLGILGMKERARRIGATFSIHRSASGGTIARVDIPLQQHEAT